MSVDRKRANLPRKLITWSAKAILVGFASGCGPTTPVVTQGTIPPEGLTMQCGNVSVDNISPNSTVLVNRPAGDPGGDFMAPGDGTWYCSVLAQ